MRTLAVALFACIAGCVPVYAQAISTSQIKGVVRDPTGLAVAGAEVKATRTDTGATRTAVTGPDGAFTLPDLPIGPYKLEATKQGFSTYVQTGIVLQVASNPTVDIALKVGAVSEQVQVEANASMVETQSTAIGTVMDSERVVDLPLIGRQPTDLVLLAGGASTGSDASLIGARNYPTAEISVGGGLSYGLTYVLDGAMHNDPYDGMGLPLPFPDALQEFKVETSAMPAQYGMHSAAAVNAVTKSGGNGFHGDGFEFVRNYIFDARDFFAATGDSLKRNQFGGTLGGPIKRNKIFFFGAFQGTTTRQNAVVTPAFVPTQQMLGGDFSAIASPACNNGRQINLKNPTNGQLFAGNQIPTLMFSTPALDITSKLPTATNACGLTTYGTVNDSNDRQSAGRLDYQISPSHTVFLRYIGVNYVAPVPYNFTHNVLTTATGAGYSELIQAVTIGDTYIITPNLVNSFRIGLNRSAIQRVGASFFDAPDVGINIYSYIPDSMNLAVTGGFSIGAQTTGSANFDTTTIQGGDDISYIKGNHQMGFGINLAHWNSNSYAHAVSQGTMSISGQATGLGLADFLLGQLTNLAEAAPNLTFERQYYLGLYAQDSWKIRPNLTVNYGLRWEPYFPMTNPQGLVYHFDPTAFAEGIHTTQFTSAPPGLFYTGDPGFPALSGMNKQWGDLAPRFGVVWDPFGDGKTSVRSSFGEFYDLVPVEYNINTVTAPPWGNKVNIISTNLANPYATYPGGDPFPVVFNQHTPFATFGTFNTWDYNTHPTYVEQWNLSLQRQLTSSLLVSASYLGTHTVHLTTSRELDPAVYVPGTCAAGQYGLAAAGPCSTLANENQRRVYYLENPAQGQYLGSVGYWDDGGTASYNSLLLTVNKRMSQNFTIVGNYTWAHCISDLVDEQMNNVASSGVYLFPNNRSLDRGNCNTSGTDHRQILNMTALAQTPQFSGKWMRYLLSGWRASIIVTAQTGSWLTPVDGVDNALTGLGNQRPNLTGQPIYGNGTPTDFINPKAFSQPASGTYGSVSVASLLGPGMLQVNIGLSRIFTIREHQTMEFRAEASNVLNRLNPSNPVVSLSANTFGTITSDVNGTVGQTGDPRILQFAIKYLF